MQNTYLILTAAICLGAVPVQAKRELPWDSGNAFLRVCSVEDKRQELTVSENIDLFTCYGYLRLA
jgi:hypothetical protein